jgi:hypothetical protein
MSEGQTCSLGRTFTKKDTVAVSPMGHMGVEVHHKQITGGNKPTRRHIA